MAEYIDLDTPLELKVVRGSTYKPYTSTLRELLDVNHIPYTAADVRPVVRGTWVGIDDFPHEDWECDNCGCVVGNTDDPWNYYHYCPNCGACMGES